MRKAELCIYILSTVEVSHSLKVPLMQLFLSLLNSVFLSNDSHSKKEEKLV